MKQITVRLNGESETKFEEIKRATDWDKQKVLINALSELYDIFKKDQIGFIKRMWQRNKDKKE